MIKHYPEPWKQEGVISLAMPLHEANWYSIIWSPKAGVDIAYMVPTEQCNANSDRIVACVNALAGLNPEAVPDVVAALREVVNWFEGNQSTQLGGTMQVITAARAALAKLEG